MTEETVVEKTVIVRLPEDLHRRFKVVLAREGKSMQELLAGVIQRYVEREETRDE